MEWRCQHVNVVKWYIGYSKSACCIKSCKRYTFACTSGIPFLEPESFHCFKRFCFPVGDYIGCIFIESEVPPYIDVEIIPVTFIPEQCIALREDLFINER